MKIKISSLLIRISSGLFLIMLFLCGCKGDTGPTGPKGQPGNSDVSVYNFSFNASDLVSDDGNSTYYYISFVNSTVGNEIRNGAASFIYIYSDSIWNPLPYTEPHDPALTIAYYFKLDSLFIEVITNNGDAREELITFLNGDVYRLRLFLIPANDSHLLKRRELTFEEICNESQILNIRK
jgi:hypothetical protein